MTLSPSKFPYAATYLAGLPHGVDSYATCTIRADAHENLRESFPGLSRIDGLPDVVHRYLVREYSEPWLPETASNTMLLLLRDTVFTSDDAFVKWVGDNVDKVFCKPVYRALIYLLSPALSVMNAGKRWNKFHQGTELTLERIQDLGGEKRVNVTLQFPPALFTPLLVRQLVVIFERVLLASRAHKPAVALTGVSSDRAAFVARWK